MNEKLLALAAKIKENKAVIIKIGAILAGAVVGGVIATVIANAQQEYPFDESELLGLETDEVDDEEDQDTEENTEE